MRMLIEIEGDGTKEFDEYISDVMEEMFHYMRKKISMYDTMYAPHTIRIRRL